MVQWPAFFALFLTGIVAVLFVHELGHLVVARYFGMKVLSLNVGFGPPLIKFADRVGTTWNLRALPIGGSCVVDDFDVAEQPTLDRKIASRVLGQRAVVYAAGPIFNLVFAASFAVSLPVLCKNCTLYGDDLGSVGATIVHLIALFSVATALFNLLPLLPLDGGRLCLTAIEAGIGRPISALAEKWFLVFSILFTISSTVSFLTWVLLSLSQYGAIW
jgi:membrane-associated protease RseP (regulator of RpoE activity)